MGGDPNGANDYHYLNKPEFSEIPLRDLKNFDTTLPLSILRVHALEGPLHRHNYLQIIYVCRGYAGHVLADNSFMLNEGDLFVVPPFVPHTFTERCSGDFQFYELEFAADFITGEFARRVFETSIFDFTYIEPFLTLQNKAVPKLHLAGNTRRVAEGLFEQMAEEYAGRFVHCDCELLLRALVMQLLVLAGREFEKEKSGDGGVVALQKEGIRAALRYIEEHCCEPGLTVDEICRHALMSASYLRYFLKLATGDTPVDCINRARVRRAAELLRACPDRHITEIAYACGFGSSTHFNRVFKQYTGAVPSELRGER